MTEISERIAENDPLHCEPVDYLGMDAGREPEEGKALCLSGGGYRAMLFHAGVLLRLNELGLLKGLNRISSVSGGSITSGLLALKWRALEENNFDEGVLLREVITPLRNLASKTVDVSSVALGSMWFGSIGDKLSDAYRKHLFGDATLQDIADNPRFVFNATNVQSGALWRFSKPYMRDYKVGEVKNPTVDLAVAVAASSAFPPVLSPVELDLDPEDFTTGEESALNGNEFKTQVVLTDGGVYDNLGLETAWKRYNTIFVSDAGGGFTPEPDPHRDWVRHSVRILLLIDNQVRSLRKRQVVGSFKAGIRSGAYWNIAANMDEDYTVKDKLPCPFSNTCLLAGVDTRLKKLDSTLQERLINWGYSVADAGLREYYDISLPAPSGFPFPIAGV